MDTRDRVNVPYEPAVAAQPLPDKLPFPSYSKNHILHCSYHWWHPRYRAHTPKARLIPLSGPFVSYLRADGILLPPDGDGSNNNSPSDSGVFSHDSQGWDSDDDDDSVDPSVDWLDVHQAVKATIKELGGKVSPKLNWSAPKDATWINATNSMDCRTANDVYLLLKSSDFVSHDLEHAFDGCSEDAEADSTEPPKDPNATIPYHLVLRKFIQVNPSVEFRCFVKNRRLLGICQRDPNHFEFLSKMTDDLRDLIEDFFFEKIKNSFPDSNYTFDVYVPSPHDRVWLIDFNPWAPRTDPILFSWLELLTWPEPEEPTGKPQESGEQFSRIYLNGNDEKRHDDVDGKDEDESDDDDIELLPVRPEFRLIRRDDPEAYSFNTAQYSAHKLPKDVVDASQSGPGGLREFAENWKDILERRQKEDEELPED